MGGENCHCQWGVSGVLIGAFIVIAAGIFTFFTTFIDIFPWQWYRDLCWFWFLLGVLIFGCGWLSIILFGCDRSKGRELDHEDSEYGNVTTPTPYIMITA